MKDKIVILGNGEEWCEKSLTDFKKYDNVMINNYRCFFKFNKFTKFIARYHFSYNLNKIINLPFKSLWYKKILNYVKPQDDERIIFVIYDRNYFANNVGFLKLLRKHYPNCKLIYMFTNVVRISGASDNGFVNELNKYYDLIYAFDAQDSEEYGFNYSPLLYSHNYLDVQEQNKAFYVGRAKDRYPMLISIFEKLKTLNINCDFYIFGVSEEEQKHKDVIKYNQYISYDECLKNIQESNCLIDAIQGNSTGYTIKVCEAVFYDKLLITTNKCIKNAPFYDERYIKIIDSVDDIDEEFFKNAGKVKYNKEYFSVDTYLKNLYKDLGEEINL